MQYLKRIIVWICIFAIMISTAVCAQEQVTDDVTGTPYESAVSFLHTLGIMRGYADGTFRPDEPITRAEFVITIARILGMDEGTNTISADPDAWFSWDWEEEEDEDFESEEEQSPFLDVPQNHWAMEAIRLMTEMGIIEGYGNGIFAPEDPIDFEQAVKMITVLLGYQYYAEARGGYPLGYMITASEIKLLKGIDHAAQEPITRGVTALLIRNALDIDMMVQTSFGDVSDYYITEDQTLLTMYLDIYKITGRVTDIGKVSINGGTTLRQNEVLINGERYESGTLNLMPYLGNYVTVYYWNNADSDVKTLIYIEPDHQTGEVLTIEADDIVSYENHTLYYWQDDKGTKTARARIAGDADAIYNGRTITSYDDTLMKPEMGSVGLVDSDKDGVFDVVIITSYETVVVGGVDVQNGLVYDKLSPGSSINLDVNDTTREISIHDKSGQPVEISGLSEWSILTIAKTLPSQPGTEKIDVTVSTDIAKGTVIMTSTDTNSQKQLIGIGEDTYLVSSVCSQTFTVGDTGNFYLDSFGEVAAYDQRASELSYGYLSEIGKEGIIASSIYLRIYTTDGKMETWPCAEKIEVDGAMIEKEDLAETLRSAAMSAMDAVGETYEPEAVTGAQMIRYKLNSEGMISKLATLAGDGNELHRLFYAQSGSSVSLRYKGGQRVLVNSNSNNASVAFLDSAATVNMYIPDGDKTDEDLYQIESTSIYKNDNTYAPREIYVSQKGDMTAAVVVFYNKSSGIEVDADTQLMLLEKVTSAMVDDEYAYKIYGLVSGASTELVCKDSKLFDIVESFQPGDAVRCEVNSQNEVIAAERIFDYANRQLQVTPSTQSGTEGNYTVTNPTKANANSQFWVTYAEVYERNKFNSNILTLRPVPNEASPEPVDYTYNFGATKYVYKFDPDTKKAVLGSVLELHDTVSTGDGSKVISCIRYLDPQVIIIYP